MIVNMKRSFPLILIPLMALLLSCSTASREKGLPGHAPTALDKPVFLAQPFPQSYSNAPTDKISVQYAVLEITKQVGLKCDFDRSAMNGGKMLKKWIAPDIRGIPCREALRQILEPCGLTYEVRVKSLTIIRKP